MSDQTSLFEELDVVSERIEGYGQPEIIVEAESVEVIYDIPAPAVSATTVPETPNAKAFETEWVFKCIKCHSVFSLQSVRCQSCYTYNSLIETDKSTVRMRPIPVVPVGAEMLHEGGYSGLSLSNPTGSPHQLIQGKAVKLSSLDSSENGEISTGEEQMDYVLGGGLVSPTVILIGGDPGVGKSRILTQIYGHVGMDYPVLYGGGEESQKSIAVRAKKLGALTSQNENNLHIIQGTDLDAFLEEAKRLSVKMAILDSLQTFHDKEFSQHKPGSQKQLKSIAEKFHKFCHANDIIGWLVCHVNKDGDFNGPNTVDHAVDTNIMLSKLDNGQVSATSSKNRNGDTEVAGLFEHRENGLKSV